MIVYIVVWICEYGEDGFEVMRSFRSEWLAELYITTKPKTKLANKGDYVIIESTLE